MRFRFAAMLLLGIRLFAPIAAGVMAYAVVAGNRRAMIGGSGLVVLTVPAGDPAMDRGPSHRVSLVQDTGARPKSLHETPACQDVFWQPPSSGRHGDPVEEPVPLSLLQ